MRAPKAVSSILTLASVALLGCAQPPPPEPQPAAPAVDVAAEAQAIRDRSAEWLRLAQAKDAAAIATGMFTADCLGLYDGKNLHGPAEIQADLESEAAKNPGSTIQWTTSRVEVAASGDLAFEMGSFTSDPDGAGEKPAENGEYVTVWKKVDGVWRAVADAATAHKAEAAPAASST